MLNSYLPHLYPQYYSISLGLLHCLWGAQIKPIIISQSIPPPTEITLRYRFCARGSLQMSNFLRCTPPSYILCTHHLAVVQGIQIKSTPSNHQIPPPPFRCCWYGAHRAEIMAIFSAESRGLWWKICRSGDGEDDR